MNDKKSFLLHVDSLEILEDMTNEQAGIFLKSLFQFQKNGTLPELEFGIKMAIKSFISQFKRDNEKWESVRQKRSQAGKASASKRQQTSTRVEIVEQNSTHVDTCQQTSTVSVNVNGNVNVNDYIPQTPLLENPKLENLWGGAIESWHIIAERQGAKFTNDEWNAIKGYAQAKPSLQPHQITGAIIQLNDWGQQGLDLRKSLLDGVQSSVRCTKLGQPFMAIVLDAKGNQLNRQQVIDRRNLIIEREERAIA
jgi:hypothetical protein